MAEINASAAWFEVAEDRSRGRIVTAEGKPSAWVYSKRGAFRVLRLYVKKGLIAKDEVPQLERMVKTSGVPKKDPLRLIRRSREELAPEDIMNIFAEIEERRLFANSLGIPPGTTIH